MNMKTRNALFGLFVLSRDTIGKSLLSLMTLFVICPPAGAAVVITASGVSGSGQTSFVFSGSSTANQSGTIRDSTGLSFSVDDTFEPDLDGNFIFNAGIQSQLFPLISGAATVTIGAETRQITHLFLDDDGSLRDDIGIRTDTPLSYLVGEASSFTGAITIAVDISDFNLGTYGLNGSEATAGGFFFAQPDDVIINIVPEPSRTLLLLVGLCAVLVRRRR